jgi:hypothetical protein
MFVIVTNLKELSVKNILATQRKKKILVRKAVKQELQAEFMTAFSALKQTVELRGKKIVPQTEFQITNHKGAENSVGQ